MHAALDIALKDLRQKVRDRSALLISVVAPFVLAALFSLILGGLEDDFHAHWGYVDLDGGEIATALEEGPLASLQEAGIVDVSRYPDPEAAQAAIEEGEIDTAIVVPAGFSAAATAGAGTTVQLLADADAVISSQVARSVLSGFASEVDAVGLSVATSLIADGSLPDAATTAELTELAMAATDPVTIVDLAVADRTAGWATFYAAAMAILFVFLAAQFGIMSIHAERRMKTLARMLAAPLAWWSIVVGKIIVSMVLAIVSMSVIIIGTGLLLGATWGDPIALIVLVLAAALAATGVSLLVVAFTKNEEQAGSAIAIVSLTLAVVGGAFFPANQGPELLSVLSQLTPHAWFLAAVDDISTGGDVTSSISSFVVLAAIGLVTGGLGLLRAKRMVFA